MEDRILTSTADLVAVREPFPEVEGFRVGNIAWWVGSIMVEFIFGKEILEPHFYPSEHPNGATIIKAGTREELCAAVLPYDVRHEPTESIVAALWPTVLSEDLEFRPDRSFKETLGGAL